MNNPCILDTSVWILALRKEFLPQAKDLVARMIDEERLVMVPIVKLELLAGTRTKKEFSRLKLRLDALPEIEMSESIWEIAQRLAFGLRRSGLSIPLIDTLILASAKSASALLIHNDKHFDMARKIAGVRTENLRLRFSRTSVSPC